jgi:hypothetical protein
MVTARAGAMLRPSFGSCITCRERGEGVTTSYQSRTIRIVPPRPDPADPRHSVRIAGLLKNLVFERDTLGVIFLKPHLRGILVRKDLQVVLVANLLAGIDID